MSEFTRQQVRYAARRARKQGRALPAESVRRLMFRRAKQAFAEIAALQAKYTGLELSGKIGELSPYRSRGHGRGTPTRNHLRPANSVHGPDVQASLRYLLGGWAKVQRDQGLTKRQYLARGAAMMGGLARG